jgi:hypothetical protein
LVPPRVGALISREMNDSSTLYEMVIDHEFGEAISEYSRGKPNATIKNVS